MGIRHERCRMSTTVALRGHSNRVAGCQLSGIWPKADIGPDQHLRPVVCKSHTPISNDLL